MNAITLKVLEYDTIIAKLSKLAGSSLGRELVLALRPLNDYALITRNLEQTAQGRIILDHGSALPLGGIRDIRSAVDKARKGIMVDIEVLGDIYSTLYAVRQIKNYMDSVDYAVPDLKEIAAGLVNIGDLTRQIERAIDEHGVLRDDASPALQRIRRQIQQSKARIKEHLQNIITSSQYQKYFQDVLVTMRGDRYVVPIKQEYRQFFPGIVHDQSASGATFYIEPLSVVQLNNEVKELLLAEKTEIERILKQLTVMIGNHSAMLLDNCSKLAQLDFIFAKARLSLSMRAVRPVLNTQGRVDLRQVRHPLIDPECVVPIDITLGDEYRVLLVTGPNTGGKTVSIKTLGMAALLTQSGLFIPAAVDSAMPVFNDIFVDIGDEQSIEHSLSTFSSHMTNIVGILHKVTDRDLFLVDEIGSGTDPREGAALAMAIINHLLERRVTVVATTHYSELKTFAYTVKGVENACVEFDVATLRPTYRLLTGIPGTSKAFAISERLGLSPELIERAKTYIDDDYTDFEEILTALEREKRFYSDQNNALRAKERELAEREHRLARLKNELNERKEKIIAKARQDSAELLRAARRDAERVIGELKEQYNDFGVQKRQSVIDAARRTLRDKIGQVATMPAAVDEGRPVDLRELRCGDTVYVVTLGQKGAVISHTDKDIYVQLGALKLNVKARDCRMTGDRLPPPTDAYTLVNFTKASSIGTSVDVRGLLVDEAVDCVAKYLDDAILAGLKRVLIIHGKGTGALRTGLWRYLENHYGVSDIAVADANEGGLGATVVKLS